MMVNGYEGVLITEGFQLSFFLWAHLLAALFLG